MMNGVYRVTDPIRGNGNKNMPVIGLIQPSQQENDRSTKNRTVAFNPFGIRNASKLIRKFVENILSLKNQASPVIKATDARTNILQITTKAKLDALKENLAQMEGADCGVELIELSAQLKLKIDSGVDLNNVKFITPQWLDRRLEEYVGNAEGVLADEQKKIVGMVVENLLDVCLLQCRNKNTLSNSTLITGHSFDQHITQQGNKSEADVAVDIIRNHEQNIPEEQFVIMIQRLKQNSGFMLLTSVENRYYINRSF